MTTGTGTQQDPIVAMSADPAQIGRDVRASLAHYGRTDDPYWLEKALTPAQFSNGLWHLGHNGYWEARMDPRNTGSADPNLGRQPAIYRDGTPTPTPPPVPSSTDVLFQLLLARLNQIDARLSDVENRGAQLFQQTVALAGLLTAPTYEGTVKIPYLGTAPITLTPKP